VTLSRRARAGGAADVACDRRPGAIRPKTLCLHYSPLVPSSGSQRRTSLKNDSVVCGRRSVSRLTSKALDQDQHGNLAGLGAVRHETSSQSAAWPLETMTFLAALRTIVAPWVLDGPIDGESFQIYARRFSYQPRSKATSSLWTILAATRAKTLRAPKY